MDCVEVLLGVEVGEDFILHLCLSQDGEEELIKQSGIWTQTEEAMKSFVKEEKDYLLPKIQL